MLKAAAAGIAALFVILAQPASADTLLTGAIRDRSGAAIRGARVTAFDAAGRVVGSDLAIADGTFAIAARTVPASIAISCDYCRTVRRAVDPGQPIVVIVDRFSALTASGPSAADIRALPYRSAADIASLQPFTVVDNGRIADLGLDQDAAVLINGLPFYRASDGSDLSQLVPAHAVAALNAASPLVAPQYGGYSDAGIYNVQLRDPDLSTSRADIGDASDVVVRADGPSGGAGYAASSDSGDDRQVADADAELPLGGGRLSFDALAMSDLLLHASGAGLAYATDSRRFATTASLSATQSDDSSLVQASAAVRNLGPLGLEFGARAARATSSLDGTAATQFDGAVYARAVRQTGLSDISATVAWDAGSDAGVAPGSQSAGIVGSFSDDVRLGLRWTAHAGAVSNLRIPTFDELSANAPLEIGGDRSTLFEQSLTYTDLQRVRVTGMTFTQRATGSATQDENGIGVDGAWQIAPQLSLRAWLLRANQSSLSTEYSPITYGLLPSPLLASALTRQLIWLSYDKYVRFDALIRGGALEGDVRIPVSPIYAFAIGTAEYNGRRVTTFGLTLR
jgi:hypothetical protein